MRATLGLALLLACSSVFPAAADASRRIQWAQVPTEGQELPADLTNPEGKTRWNLTRLETMNPRTRTIEDRAGAIAVRDLEGEPAEPSTRDAPRSEGPERPIPQGRLAGAASSSPEVGRALPRPLPLPGDGTREILYTDPVAVRASRADDRTSETLYADPAGGDAATIWIHPDRFRSRLAPGTSYALVLERTQRGARDRVRIEVTVAGIGWVHLPSGPREVVLQRVLLSPGGGSVPDRLGHRWVDPVEGVLAEVWGTASPNARSRAAVSEAGLRTDVSLLSPLTKLYDPEVIAPVLTSIGFGWERGYTPISELTSPSFASSDALVASGSWTFTAPPSRRQIVGTTTATSSSTDINGTGTNFQLELKVNDRISLSSAPDVYATVTSIDVGTSQHLTVNTGIGNGTTQTIFRRTAEIASTSVNVAANETCNATRCGYSVPGAIMDREDKNFDDATSLNRTNAVSEKIQSPGNVTYWLRAGAQNEGTGSNLIGNGESKFCWITQGATTRTEVPLWVFGHQDAGGYYFQPGDAWGSSAITACEPDLWNQKCATCPFIAPCQLYAKACTGHTGRQTGTVIKSGVLTLPSGHTFNALLVRTIADFCVYGNSGCSNLFANVGTVVDLWQVPHLGTAVRLNSPQDVSAAGFNYTNVTETNIAFGLYPPRTIQVTGVTNTTVSLSWDPGLDARRIDATNGYRVYWGATSGSVGYTNDSLTNPGQVVFGGTSATISGLTQGTPYYFTVTSRSTFTNPSSGAVTTYESLKYPTQVSGDPNHVYPIEVQATPGLGCGPATEVTGLLVTKAGGGVQFCWSPTSDACATHYRILGANSATSAGGFTTVAETAGLETCLIANPSQRYFLVVAVGGNGAAGPWGHYGQ